MRKFMHGLLLACALAGPAAASDGALVIVGGALDPANEAVYRAFIDAAAAHAGNPAAPRFVIVPAASGAPSESAETFAAQLRRYGVDAAQIAVAKIALRDDPGTPTVNEADWAQGARAPSEIAKVEQADGVWFVGGDQARVVATLKTETGDDTPLLFALRARLSRGAAIGGASAGAAIMSQGMILRGDSLPALIAPPDGAETAKGENLALGHGLGFLGLGIVDQHFDKRARLGRLVRAVATLPASSRIGFGVDENTALVVDLGRGVARAIGAGGVTVVDARAARFDTEHRPFAMSAARLSILDDEDAINLATLEVRPSSRKSAVPLKAVSGASAPHRVEGIAAPAERLEDALADDLPRLGLQARLHRPSFGADGLGVSFDFGRLSSSRVYEGRDLNGRTRTTIVDVSFDVSPIRVLISSADKP